MGRWGCEERDSMEGPENMQHNNEQSGSGSGAKQRPTYFGVS
jgi:hypothetical protein